MENNQQVATSQQPVTAIQKFNTLLSNESIKKKFDEVLGKKAPMFISTLTTVMSGSAELQKCEQMSIISSALMAASMDLPITPGLGFAGIVPFWDSKSGTFKAQFQVMKKGYVQLAQRTGLFKIINVSEVYEGELKVRNRFTGEFEFDESGRKSDKIIGYVSYFRLVNGFEKYYYMTIEQIEKHANKYSKAFQKGLGKWADKEEGGFEQMCEKTVLKLNLSTYAPLSVDTNLINAVIYDQAEIRNMEATDFTYPDNEHSQLPEKKDVIEVAEGKTLVTKPSTNERSSEISASVSQSIAKSKGEIKSNEGVEEAHIVSDPDPSVQQPAAEEGKPPLGAKLPVPKLETYTESMMISMDLDELRKICEERLAPAKYKVLQAVPQKKTNKLYRNALLALWEGRIDAYLVEMTKDTGEGEKVAQDNSNLSQTAPASGELFPKETKPADAPAAVSQNDAVRAFEAEKKETVLLPSDIVEPGPNGRQPFDAITVFEFLNGHGIADDDDLQKASGGKHVKLEAFCKNASNAEILSVLR